MQANTQQTASTINCDYKIPADTKSISPSLVLDWSEKATTQAFDFTPATLDAQMDKLKSCFTDQGWISFNTALQKSGNIEAIKNQKLTVSSQIDGQAQVVDAKENQWKITLPLQVVYQNEKEKVTQLLTVSLTVGRKVNGDLGITQMIAAPRTNTNNTQSTPAPHTEATPATNTNTNSNTTAPVNAGTTGKTPDTFN